MIEKPKKERRFLKILGKVGEILVQELLIKVGKSLVQKIGGKKTLPSIIFLSLFYNIAIASVDSIPYPITGNKQRLGWQTTGNGLVYRGLASDTITKPSNYANKDIKAYLLLDTVNNVMYSYIASKGGWKFNNSDTVIIQGATMPFDSITFNTAKDGTVGVGEVEYNDTQGSLIQGLKGGNVTNVIGQQLHQRVNNRTGAALAKGDVVYLSGSQGNRITVAKALATSDPTSANTFGIVAESIADNASGYVITEGLITGLNTSALTQDSAVYLSGTTAGALTSIKPQAPIHGVYIGVCVKSNNGSGELFVKIRNGLELDELHDVQITSPVNNASLYYKSSEGLWRDTTAALLVSDTAAMLIPYLRKLDTITLSNRINTKLNISDTASMLTPYFRDADTTSLNLTSRFAAKLNLSDTASMLTNYLRTGLAASTYLTQSNAASTYLPLTGGTISGSILNSWTNAYSSAPRNDGAVRRTYTQNLYSANGGTTDRVTHYYTFSSDECCASAPVTMYYGRFNGFYNQANIIYDASIYYHSNNQFYYRAFSESENKVTFSIKPSTTTGSSIIGTKADLYLSGDAQIDRSLNIGTTLGVTGATTLSAPLTVNSSAVFNEGSADADFRVESDGNANMVFVDASTDRVGIGTSSPSYLLDVNGTLGVTGATTLSNLAGTGTRMVTASNTGALSTQAIPTGTLVANDTVSLSNRINTKVGLTGNETINGTKTFGGLIVPTNGMMLTATGNNSNKLIGINASTFVGEVTLGSGLSITSNVLNVAIPTERYYFDLGIVAGAADNSASTYDFTYGSNIFIVPTSLNGYCIDSVYIRAIGCSTCPPVSPDLDYYVGVYKANAGARVTTSGATLVGSQITMNEYDLNEVNRNDTISTGEAWWVYLNGTYTSDMAYITAGFVVKKTCN